MRTLGTPKRVPGVAGLLAAVVLAAGCGANSDAATPPLVTQHFRVVMLSVSPGSSYSEAVERGARERAAALGVVLDVVRARAGSTTQVEQLRDAVNSGQYIGGLIVPVVQGELCDVGTNLAPDNNFMLAVANTPICGREAGEGEAAWAPGTLTFVSAGEQVSDFAAWADYIRAENPGRQKVVLLAGPQSAGHSRNAESALSALASGDPEFRVAPTVHTDGTEQDAIGRLQAALRTHPDATIVASIRPELTTAAAKVLAGPAKSRVRVYDVGGSSEVLDLIESGRVRMTAPQYPQTLGATAVQALYDARIGRTPITRFYATRGGAAPAGPKANSLVFVTEANLAQFRAARVSEY